MYKTREEIDRFLKDLHPYGYSDEFKDKCPSWCRKEDDGHSSHDLRREAVDIIRHLQGIIDCENEEHCEWIPSPCLRHAKEIIKNIEKR